MHSFTELQRDHLARHLRKHLAGEVRFDTAARHLYSTDASIYQMEPLGVVIPRSVEDIVATVQIAANASGDHACEVIGEGGTATEDYPPRDLVESFPTDKALQRIGMEHRV